ncbi:MAG: 16S rRNA (guanine(966)-N(2))-methyltransferase RsmD [Methylobacter sp.]|nr:16S rRNA (guanine(966)-N(2))-methyltransferase RsmD [Methylobacter sp.]MDP2100392.1 16S rRNA (guanine(966)-N(2))-methyltransferase RsmD [Methylobacter sp.]MDP2427878.1 16S rRNA (guanine(966)-N(2))-methyltransferase RsmD [Methylobacter sp.]MDP3053864.1 16S rRNA (guanine(966)-N(2))-methyltransferase RsmD [Methylobacter sp.]MDP3363568.1 16S rRNA (guanine(966)-N(2))-methyltransferase RsmD [Methylobacter sp.]
MKNKLRIIGGDWRSRQLSFVDAPGLRPTPARVRETLFNWLQYEIVGKRCLDLYAGSGALGFEAASRGAKSVVQVENNVHACRSLKDNALALSATQITAVQSDVFRYLAGQAQVFDVVFLDPPFGLDLVVQTCQLLEQNGWLAKQAKIYVETELHFDFSGMPENWRPLKSKNAGEVAYHLFGRSPVATK